MAKGYSLKIKVTKKLRMAVRINSELKTCRKDYQIELEGDNITKWIVTLTAPDAQGSPYEGGKFRVLIDLENNYPWKPPEIRFMTPIYHPGVSKEGGVCTKSLSDEWSPKRTISKDVLPFLISLLSGEPDASNAMNQEAASLLRDDPKAFNKKVLAMVRKHAL